MAADDGGPAFPCVGGNSDDFGCGLSPGMTLRDWFAGQALAGNFGLFPIHDMPEAYLARDAALFAYKLADAMLAAQKRPTSPPTRK